MTSPTTEPLDIDQAKKDLLEAAKVIDRNPNPVTPYAVDAVGVAAEALAEVERLRGLVDTNQMFADTYLAAQKAFDTIHGPDEGDGAGGGLLEEIWLLAQQRDEARANAGLTFRQVSDANRTRAERWHPGFPNDGWTGADWATAMAGEAGEACNVVKKLRRDDFALVQAAAAERAGLVAKLATEIGDTFLYLDLLAQHYGLDLAECVTATFNRVSVREGFPDRLPTDDVAEVTR